MLQITRFLINNCKEFMILARNGFFLFAYNSKYDKKPDSAPIRFFKMVLMLILNL